MTVVSSMMIGAIATMMVHCGTMTWSTPPAIRITMDMGVATTRSTPPTWWIIMRIATAWTTSPTRWIIVNPLIFRCFFSCHLCAICVLLKIFGAFSALDLKKLQSYILILLEGSTHLIQLTSLRGLTANHTEDLGQERCDEHTTHLFGAFSVGSTDWRKNCRSKGVSARTEIATWGFKRQQEQWDHWFWQDETNMHVTDATWQNMQTHGNILVKYGEMNLKVCHLKGSRFGTLVSSHHHFITTASFCPTTGSHKQFCEVLRVSDKFPWNPWFAENTSKLSVGFESSSNKHINNSFLVKLYYFPSSFVVKFENPPWKQPRTGG